MLGGRDSLLHSALHHLDQPQLSLPVMRLKYLLMLMEQLDHKVSFS